MKALRIVAATIFAFAFGNAYAFHSGGVAECEGCHTMHNTLGNNTGAGVGNGARYLLQGNDQASTCLNCHNSLTDVAPTSYHISTDQALVTPTAPPVEMTPGGDFGWLRIDYNFTVRGSPYVNAGASRGHSIVAADYNYAADPSNATAPGGTYPADNLACSSCHDPHGKYRRDAAGNISTTGLPIWNSGSYNNSRDPIAGVSAVGVYRILGGVGYQPKSLAGNFAFANPPPAAVAPSTYNRSEATSQTHVAYGSGMSEWCGNCHPAMVENAYVSGAPGHRHPAGTNAKLTAAIVANYNSYVTSGIMTNTDPTRAYSTLAPFELGLDQTLASYTTMKTLAVNTDTQNQSASVNANVSCLSCHRAHASGFQEMLRFGHENEFMTIADASNAAAYDASTTSGAINRGMDVNTQTAAYYGRPASAFGPYARLYCNKCHAKD